MKLFVFVLAILTAISIASSHLEERQSESNRTTPPSNIAPKEGALKVHNFKLSGDGCPEKSSGFVTYLDDSTFTFIFDNFTSLNSLTRGNGVFAVNRTCVIDITMTLPPLYKLINFKVQSRGYSQVGKGASSGGNVLFYYFNATSRVCLYLLFLLWFMFD
jgi:hypothetical protein